MADEEAKKEEVTAAGTAKQEPAPIAEPVSAPEMMAAELPPAVGPDFSNPTPIAAAPSEPVSAAPAPLPALPPLAEVDAARIAPGIILPVQPLDQTPVSAAAPPAQEPAPPVPPEPLIIAPEVAGPGQQHSIDADIANILKEVKLPERRGEAPKRAIEHQAPAFGALPSMDTSPFGAGPQEDTSLAGMQAPKIPPVMPEKPSESAQSPVQALHTMKTDAQEFFRQTKMSVIRAAAMKQDKKASDKPAAALSAPHAPRQTGRIVLLLALLLACGAAVVFGMSLLNGRAGNPPPTPAQYIFAESQTSLSIDDQSASALKQTLLALMGRQNSIGSITQIIPTTAGSSTTGTQSATLTQFFTALGISPPPDLMRALSDQFFFGVHAADVPSPVFIIPVTSYDHAFAGMLAWEPTMDSDLSPLFAGVPPLVPAQNGALPAERTFQDLVMRNYDVRALENDNGSVVLYYSFPTPELLVISGSPYTFPEVLSRLQAERKL